MNEDGVIVCEYETFVQQQWLSSLLFEQHYPRVKNIFAEGYNHLCCSWY